MPAQLVVVGYRNLSEADGEKASAKQRKGGKAERRQEAKPPEGTQLPKWRPFPVTTAVFVCGQHPSPVGEFESIPALLKSLATSGELHGGPSSTVFATVRNIENLRLEDLDADLAKLPDKLTIVVGHGAPDA